MKASAPIVVFTLFLFCWKSANGQNVSTSPAKREALIEMTDGRQLNGVFLRGDTTTLEIETESGIQSIKIEKIITIRFLPPRLTISPGTPGAITIVYRSPGRFLYHRALSCPLATTAAKPISLADAVSLALPCPDCDPPTLKDSATTSRVDDLPSTGNSSSSPLSQSPQPSVSGGGISGDGKRSRSSEGGGRKTTNGANSGYILGPRGGCYYINRNGNKTYVSRSLCK